MRDVERLWAAGFALGSSLENSIVIGDGVVVNPEGLRYPDEFVRHKVLDTIGDLALAGAPIQGLYRSHRGGHKLNAMALSALLSRTDAWSLVSDAVERETRPEGARRARRRASGRRPSRRKCSDGVSDRLIWSQPGHHSMVNGL